MSRSSLSAAATLVSAAALAVAAYSLGARTASPGDADGHRCGQVDASTLTCLANDSPRQWQARECLPANSRGVSVVVWVCRRERQRNAG
jgi:hypothetical protein